MATAWSHCTPYTQDVFKQAAQTAVERKHQSFGTEHVVHALVLIKGPALAWVAELAGACPTNAGIPCSNTPHALLCRHTLPNECPLAS